VGVVALVLVLIAAAVGQQTTVGPIVFPIVAVYTALAIRRWGTTIGKASFELEVVTIDTASRPSWSQALRRQFVAGAVPITGSAVEILLEVLDIPGVKVVDVVTGISLPVLAAVLLHASLRMQGKRAPWDRVAGTMVRYHRTRQR
jgi:uncharacterized RDD family membrane protein YckC